MNIGEAMKKIREENDMTRTELARHLTVTPSALSKIERGKVWPKPTTIEAFCKCFGVPVAYLYQRSFTLEDFMY